MTGRNNAPKDQGVSGHPSRLDQYGDQLAASHETNKTACETEERKRDK